MKSPLPPFIAAFLTLALPASGALIWTPDGASPGGNFGTDMTFNSVISYGTLADGPSCWDYEVVFLGMEQWDTSGTPIANPTFSNNNSFEVSGGLADLNTQFETGANSNGDASYVDVQINFFDKGTYTPGGAVAGALDGELMVGSGTAASVELGITAPNHVNFNVLNNIEEFGINWTNGGGSGNPLIYDPYSQIETNPGGGTVDPQPGFDYTLAAGAPGFGNDVDMDGQLDPFESDYNFSLPAATSYVFRRSDSDSSGRTGSNSAIGFSVAAPEPSRALLLGITAMIFLARRRR